MLFVVVFLTHLSIVYTFGTRAKIEFHYIAPASGKDRAIEFRYVIINFQCNAHFPSLLFLFRFSFGH